jgi:hypothetical protein
MTFDSRIASFIFTTAALQTLTDQEKQAVYASPLWPIVMEIRNTTLREDKSARVFIHRIDIQYNAVIQILLTNEAGMNMFAVARGSGEFHVRSSASMDSHPDYIWGGTTLISSQRPEYVRQQIRKSSSTVSSAIRAVLVITDKHYNSIVNRTVIGYLTSKSNRGSTGHPTIGPIYSHAEATYMIQVAMGERTFGSLPDTFKHEYTRKYETYVAARDKWYSGINEAKTIFGHDKWMIGISHTSKSSLTQIVVGKVRAEGIVKWIDQTRDNFGGGESFFPIDAYDFKVYPSVDYIEEPIRKELDMRLTMLNIYRGVDTDPWAAETYISKSTSYADSIPPVFWGDARATAYWNGSGNTMWLLVDTYE